MPPAAPLSATAICRIAVPVPLDRLFDYLLPVNIDPDLIKPGIRVRVPFGNNHKTGVLISLADISQLEPERLKNIESIIDSIPLLSSLDIQLLTWASQYYHYPIGEVMATAFPVALRKGKAARLPQEKLYQLSDKGRLLNLQQLKRAPQQQALFSIIQRSETPVGASLLAQHNKNWRGIIKALSEKGLVSPAVSENLPQPSAVCRQPALRANSKQQHAITSVCAVLGQFQTFMLEGVTGSGKTEVYMQIIAKVLQRGMQALVLLPEITLTPQLEQRFCKRFNIGIVASHSKMSENQRLSAWLQFQQGKAGVMLGTRSALFTPFHRPGIIILDEEHDSSFKQQEGFRYSTRDVAVVRAKNHHIPVVLGSATPSLESLYNVKQQRYRLLHLPDRAGNAVPPKFQLLDIRNKKIQDGLSEMLLAEIRNTLARQEQVLLFLNRRGFAPVQMCHSCGHVSRCQRCDANLVIHYDERLLRCHHCAAEQAMLRSCPACKQGELRAIGLGTERIEKTLKQLFPDRQILRLDRDTTQRKGTLEEFLEQINSGHTDIVLGTQMLAKGHHFPDVTLVALLDVDSSLFSIDFHSAEKLAQMIVQVAGRAGRAHKQGKVILQTRHPEHPLLNTLLQQGYQAFAESALEERKAAHLPPFSHQALLRVRALNPELPQRFLTSVLQALQSGQPDHTRILGPVPAPMTKRAGQFRYQLLMQSERRKELHQLLDKMLTVIPKIPELKKVRWSLDVDPVDLY